MFVCEFDFVGVADLMWTEHVRNEKREDETYRQYEERTWQEKVHTNPDGTTFIPPFAVKNGLESAAQWLSEKIPGARGKTYTKRFQSGTLVTEKLPLVRPDGTAIVIDDWEQRWIFAPADGKRGGPKRTDKIFPTLSLPWQVHGHVQVFDNMINEDVVQRHLRALGRFIAFGAMRAGNGGINGRCSLENFVATEQEI